MQISQISAENFLSFGVGDDGFVLDLNTREESESSAVTVLTGANGSGKTNVIRVLQQILDALRNPSDLLSDLRFSYHRTQIGSDEKPVRLDLAHKPSELTMVCHFDKDEQTLLSDWWRMACGSGENLERLDSETAQSAAPLRLQDLDSGSTSVLYGPCQANHYDPVTYRFRNGVGDAFRHLVQCRGYSPEAARTLLQPFAAQIRRAS